MDDVEERLAWRMRPCSDTWTLRRRPCGWYKFGRHCRRTWGELVAPYNYFVVFGGWFNVMVASAFIWDAALRKDACAPEQSNTPYQRLLFITTLGFIAVGLASTDVRGDNKLLGPEWRQGLQCTIRILIEVALFEVGDKYNNALKSLMMRPATTAVIDEGFGGTKKVAIRTSLAALYSIVVGTWEIIGVPRKGRNGCVLALPNTLRNMGTCGLIPRATTYLVGTAAIEFSFFLWTYRNAREAKKNIANKLRGNATSRLHAERRLVETLTTHIAALSLFLLAVFLFAIFAGLRNAATGTFLCEQPVCNRAAYPFTFLWAIFYHIGVWICVLALVPNRLATRFNDFLAWFVPDAGDIPLSHFVPNLPWHGKKSPSDSSESIETPSASSANATEPHVGGVSSSDSNANFSSPRTRARAFFLEEDTKFDEGRRSIAAYLAPHELRAACAIS